MVDQYDKELLRLESEAIAVCEMQKTPGWAVINKSLNHVLDVLKDKVVFCEDPQDTARLQERCRALKSLLDAVSTYDSLLDYYRRELQEHKDHNKYDLN